MPLMNGRTATTKIREFEQENHIKLCQIIIISANSVESEISACLDPSGLIRQIIYEKAN